MKRLQLLHDRIKHLKNAAHSLTAAAHTYHPGHYPDVLLSYREQVLTYAVQASNQAKLPPTTCPDCQLPSDESDKTGSGDRVTEKTSLRPPSAPQPEPRP
jgi:hypothetical protein